MKGRSSFSGGVKTPPGSRGTPAAAFLKPAPSSRFFPQEVRRQMRPERSSEPRPRGLKTERESDSGSSSASAGSAKTRYKTLLE
ncbi:hypothetical protein AOLI_G00211350 [Acnodon oligacanthus]